MNYSAETYRKRRAAMQSIQRSCLCGRVIVGNVAWWSHTHHPDGTERDGHGFNGRA